LTKPLFTLLLLSATLAYAGVNAAGVNAAGVNAPDTKTVAAEQFLKKQEERSYLTKPLFTLLLLSATLAYAGVNAAGVNAAGVNAPDPKTVAAEQFLKKQQDSLDRQRASLHQQLSGEAIGASAKAADPTAEPAAYFIDPLSALPQADCDRLDKTSVESLIAAAAKNSRSSPRCCAP